MFDFLKNKKGSKDDISSVLAPILPEDIYQSGVLELRDIIAPSALKVSPKTLNLGEKLARTFFVISYPRFLSTSWFTPIINLDKIFDISIFIHPIDSEQALRELQKKVAEVQSQIHMRERRAWCATLSLIRLIKTSRFCATNFNKPKNVYLTSAFTSQFMVTLKMNWRETKKR